jgi:hypothetical protein
MSAYLDEPVELRIALDGGGFDRSWGSVSTGTIVGNEGFYALAKRVGFDPELFTSPRVADLTIGWPDYGKPHMPASWWVSLNNFLHEIDGHVQAGCIGGHGRTGTFSAILAGLNDWCGTADPVQWVRDNYCPETVESWEQIEYIESILDRPIIAKPRDHGKLVYGSSVSTLPGKKLPPPKITVGAPQDQAGGPILSIKRWKKLARKTGDLRRPSELLDGERFTDAQANLFVWDKCQNRWRFWDSLSNDEQSFFFALPINTTPTASSVSAAAVTLPTDQPQKGTNLIGEPEKMTTAEIINLWSEWDRGVILVSRSDSKGKMVPGKCSVNSMVGDNVLAARFLEVWKDGDVSSWQRGEAIWHIGVLRWVYLESKRGGEAQDLMEDWAHRYTTGKMPSPLGSN